MHTHIYTHTHTHTLAGFLEVTHIHTLCLTQDIHTHIHTTYTHSHTALSQVLRGNTHGHRLTHTNTPHTHTHTWTCLLTGLLAHVLLTDAHGFDADKRPCCSSFPSRQCFKRHGCHQTSLWCSQQTGPTCIQSTGFPSGGCTTRFGETWKSLSVETA